MSDQCTPRVIPFTCLAQEASNATFYTAACLLFAPNWADAVPYQGWKRSKTLSSTPTQLTTVGNTWVSSIETQNIVVLTVLSVKWFLQSLGLILGLQLLVNKSSRSDSHPTLMMWAYIHWQYRARKRREKTCSSCSLRKKRTAASWLLCNMGYYQRPTWMREEIQRMILGPWGWTVETSCRLEA